MARRTEGRLASLERKMEQARRGRPDFDAAGEQAIACIAAETGLTTSQVWEQWCEDVSRPDDDERLHISRERIGSRVVDAMLGNLVRQGFTVADMVAAYHRLGELTDGDTYGRELLVPLFGYPDHVRAAG